MIDMIYHEWEPTFPSFLVVLSFNPYFEGFKPAVCHGFFGWFPFIRKIYSSTWIISAAKLEIKKKIHHHRMSSTSISPTKINVNDFIQGQTNPKLLKNSPTQIDVRSVLEVGFPPG